MSFAFFCGDLILEVPASKSRIQDWFRRPSNIEKCLKNLELLSQSATGPELLRKVRQQNNAGARFDALL